MGVLDRIIPSLLYGLGFKKKVPFDYYDTDEANFERKLPAGRAFVFLTSMRELEPLNKGINLADISRGGIQGAGGRHSPSGGSYWIHSGVGYKHGNGKIEVLEAIETGITLRELSVYYEPVNQLKLFFPPLKKSESRKVWNKALTLEGTPYDYGEVADHLLPKGVGQVFGSDKKYVCGSFSRWAFKDHFHIMNPNIPEQEGAPKDINEWLQPNMNVDLMVYNLNPEVHS
jgi:hypothetical protein